MPVSIPDDIDTQVLHLNPLPLLENEAAQIEDSLRAPIHRWFTYPAGFSYKGVEEAFRLYEIRAGMTVYEPFAGTATTNIVAKQQGVHSFGVEAHPFGAHTKYL